MHLVKVSLFLRGKICSNDMDKLLDLALQANFYCALLASKIFEKVYNHFHSFTKVMSFSLTNLFDCRLPMLNATTFLESRPSFSSSFYG